MLVLLEWSVLFAAFHIVILHTSSFSQELGLYQPANEIAYFFITDSPCGFPIVAVKRNFKHFELTEFLLNNKVWFVILN